MYLLIDRMARGVGSWFGMKEGQFRMGGAECKTSV